MIQIRLLGAAFVLAAYLLYRVIRRARARGFIGPRYRRIHREHEPLRFRMAIAVEGLCMFGCLAAAYLCLTHSVSQF